MKKRFILIAALVISQPSHAAVAGAVSLMHAWSKEKTVHQEQVEVKRAGSIYDCRIAEISPDVPNKVRALCRKKIAETRKQKYEETLRTTR